MTGEELQVHCRFGGTCSDNADLPASSQWQDKRYAEKNYFFNGPALDEFCREGIAENSLRSDGKNLIKLRLNGINPEFHFSLVNPW